MKKIKLFIFIVTFVMIISFFPESIHAANEYEFKMDYIGNAVANIEAETKVLLIGTNGSTYTNVRIKVDVNGPSKPKILATDSSGKIADIAQLGYWGPKTGFAVQGDFTNTTPVKVTFNQGGNYEIILSLLDVKNGNNVITSKTINIHVLDEEIIIDKLPQTGIGINDYLIYIIPIGIIGILTFLIVKLRKKQSTRHR